MPRYIVPARLELSFDPSFSLLARNSGAFTANGTSYPRMITLEDGARHPLFNGGVVSAAEIEQIAAGTARAIVDEEHGADILIVQVLEGAKPFCQKVLKYLVDKDAERKIEVELASLKVSSYTDGSRATSHRILIPLQDSRGREITSLGKFETVVVIDDLIDTGATFAWLVSEYLPRFSPKALAGYFMLDKNRKRSKEVEEVLAAYNPLCGKLVADEWLVGLGLDIALPGLSHGPLHLFRAELPGGIYAFNSSIEQRLIKEYQARPQRVIEQLAVYVSAE